MMAKLRDDLGWVLLACLGLRLAAWLVGPVIPLLGVLFLVAAMAQFMLGGPR